MCKVKWRMETLKKPKELEEKFPSVLRKLLLKIKKKPNKQKP